MILLSSQSLQSLGKSRFVLGNRELKIETFSGRRRPDWQSNPGTEVAVASLQVRGITNYSKQFSIHTFHLYDTLTKKVS